MNVREAISSVRDDYVEQSTHAVLTLLARTRGNSSMVLDAELRQQLIEARSRIAEQLEEIRSRMLAGNPHGGGGAPNYESIVAELVNQLGQINELLTSDANEDPS